MKTIFKISIYAQGQHLNDIVQMIATHNAGMVNIDIDVLAAYMEAKRAQFPIANKGLYILTQGDNAQVIFVSDDSGETFYMRIEEIESDNTDSWIDPLLLKDI